MSSGFGGYPIVCSFKYFFCIPQQTLVPESQISPDAEELIRLKENPNSPKEFAKPPERIKNSTQGDRKNSQSEVNMVSK